MAALNLGRAQENMFSHEQNLRCTEKWVEKLVAQGKLPPSALEAIMKRQQDSLIPTTTITSRPMAETVPQYVKARIPAARGAINYLQDMSPSLPSLSMGRGRWTTADGSIFDIAEGKRMAQEPAKVATPFERARMARVSKAAVESPLLSGYRLLPQFTPGRAMMWGTILALWGTGAIVASSSRSLGIRRVEEAEVKLRESLDPYIDWVADRMEPVRKALTFETLRRSANGDTQISRLSEALRRKLSNLEKHSSS